MTELNDLSLNGILKVANAEHDAQMAAKDARIAKLEAQLAELAAENERLREENMAMEMAHGAGAALSRTGAVKVKALEVAKVARMAAETMIAKNIQWALAPAYIITLCDEIERLYALEPAAPEGQQPVAWLCIRGDNIGLCFPSDEGAFPVYATRPSEQAVTEAGIEDAARLITKWLGYSWDGLHDGRVTDRGFPVFTHGQFGWGFQGRKGDMLDLARNALKAAMEAGG